jgi:8-oxo-dGTP pyrophosphatase MutT (NUDIX family)
MSYPFSAAFRDELAARCLDFPRVAYSGGGLKRAAVVITLVDSDDAPGQTALLLTRRASKMRAHAGQWALPGGRCDPGETALHGAVRELKEELGLSLAPGDYLGMLDDYETRSGYVISPVVAWLEDASALQPNPDEVASVHRIRLDELAGAEAVEFITITESPRPVIRLRVGDSQVHAPTAALIYQLSELAAGRITRVSHLEQPVFAWR